MFSEDSGCNLLWEVAGSNPEGNSGLLLMRYFLGAGYTGVFTS